MKSLLVVNKCMLPVPRPDENIWFPTNVNLYGNRRYIFCLFFLKNASIVRTKVVMKSLTCRQKMTRLYIFSLT